MLYDSFKVLPQGEKAPPGYSYVPMHTFFTVKFDEQCKTCYIIGGNVTQEIETDEVYAPVRSIDFIQILFSIVIMNDLDVRMVDISCEFLQSKCKEKLFTKAGMEWGQKLLDKFL